MSPSCQGGASDKTLTAWRDRIMFRGKFCTGRLCMGTGIPAVWYDISSFERKGVIKWTLRQLERGSRRSLPL